MPAVRAVPLGDERRGGGAQSAAAPPRSPDAKKTPRRASVSTGAACAASVATETTPPRRSFRKDHGRARRARRLPANASDSDSDDADPIARGVPPDAAPQRRMVLSYDALARRRPEDAWVGPNAASAETLPACPTSSVAAAPFAASQRRILESIPPVAGRPSAQCATHVTHSRWPTRAPYSVRRARGFGVGLGGFVGAPPGSLGGPGGISSSYAAWSVPPTTKRLASAGERDADVSGRSLTRTVSPADAIGPACQARATRAGGRGGAGARADAEGSRGEGTTGSARTRAEPSSSTPRARKPRPSGRGTRRSRGATPRRRGEERGAGLRRGRSARRGTGGGREGQRTNAGGGGATETRRAGTRRARAARTATACAPRVRGLARLAPARTRRLQPRESGARVVHRARPARRARAARPRLKIRFEPRRAFFRCSPDAARKVVAVHCLRRRRRRLGSIAFFSRVTTRLSLPARAGGGVPRCARSPRPGRPLSASRTAPCPRRGAARRPGSSSDAGARERRCGAPPLAHPRPRHRPDPSPFPSTPPSRRRRGACSTASPRASPA